MARKTRRDLKKEAFWRRMLQGQVRSGLSVRAWCDRHRLRESAFYWWRTQLARRDAAAPPFAPVRVVADVPPRAVEPGTAGRIEIVLPGGRHVRVVGCVERQMLADVLAVLADPASATEAPAC
jgi:transposase